MTEQRLAHVVPRPAAGLPDTAAPDPVITAVQARTEIAEPDPLAKRFLNIRPLLSFASGLGILAFVLSRVDVNVAEIRAKLAQTNLPLFLLGGPACYFVDDVSYHGEARLSGQVFDLNAIRAEHATLEDGRAQLLHVESRFQEATLDFLDRASEEKRAGLAPMSSVARMGWVPYTENE